MYEREKLLLPEFPRTKHLPLEPNASRDDLVASEQEMAELLACPTVYVEEKVDGANSGITVLDGNPVIRNRTHILNKGYAKRGIAGLRKVEVGLSHPAKGQFVPIWSWFYRNRLKFQQLERWLGFVPSVYGEWMYAKHVIRYDYLPDYFLAYDVYNAQERMFLDTGVAREALAVCGFSVVPLLGQGTFTADELLSMRDGYSSFSRDPQREGIYLKGCDGDSLCLRYKMVAPHFKSDDDWVNKALVRNRCR